MLLYAMQAFCLHFYLFLQVIALEMYKIFKIFYTLFFCMYNMG